MDKAAATVVQFGSKAFFGALVVWDGSDDAMTQNSGIVPRKDEKLGLVPVVKPGWKETTNERLLDAHAST